MYPAEVYEPMKAQLVNEKFEDLTTADSVNEMIAKGGTTFFVLNSVCGCAAGSARPAAINALANEKLPQNLATVFAGVDKEAVDALREKCAPYPPSSPSMALFKEGKLVHFIERHQIEGNNAETITEHLKSVFNHFC